MCTYWPFGLKGLTANGMVLGKVHSALPLYREHERNSSTVTDMIDTNTESLDS